MAESLPSAPPSFEEEFLATFNAAPPYSQPAPASASTPENHQTNDQSNGPRLNPRSCVTCRRRKVRCDKREPCSNCTKAHIECVFPPPGRAPRKPRRPQDAELLKRLRRLESVVDSLGNQVDEDESPTLDHESVVGSSVRLTEVPGEWPTPNMRKTSLEHSLGKLVIKEGRSRYVSNDFWASLGDEVSELRDVLENPSSEDEDEAHSPETVNDPAHPFQHHQGFVFGYSSLMHDMDRLHPSPSQIFILWEIYKENVDPVLKVLHAPTVKNVIMKAAVNASSLSKASESLFYSICFAATISMSEDQCRSLLDLQKEQLMQKYRFAAEQGLARAAFLNSSSLMVLQSFILYLMTVRFVDSSRAIWSLAGLAVQQAQAQGLHRDPENFNLDPFETEMRRRLWWHISMLDARASEDHGADPTFNTRFFDTRLPSNLNDEDIWPGMKDCPKERPGASDMTFSLVRFELSNVQRKLRLTTNADCPGIARERTLSEQEELIDTTHHMVEEKYLQHCDPNVPLLWVCATVGRLILAKMWLMVHHPRLIRDGSNAPSDLRDRIFTTCVEVIEFGHLLSTNKNTAKWSWLFKTYMQWHAVAYILSELAVRPASPEAERAWAAIDGVYDKRMQDQARAQRSVFWKPIKQLYAKAKAHRSQTGLVSSLSPNSNQSANNSNSDQLSPDDNNTSQQDPWLIGYPYGNAVSSVANSLGLDFGELGPEFNLNMMNVDVSQDMAGVSQNATQELNAPIGGMPWPTWNPSLNDEAFRSTSQQNWATPSQQQEWF